MNMNDFISSWDSVVEEHNVEKAKDFLVNAIATAKVEGDNIALLTIYNEGMGFLRETGDKKLSFEFAQKALEQIKILNLENHPVYATTLQNIASAYRAGGRLEDALRCYEKIMECYDGILDETDMMYATMYNNMSLLKQEQQDFATAKAFLLKALDIIMQNDNAVFEEATTCANLSSTCAILDDQEEAMEYGRRAVALFDECKVKDAHYAAALNGLGTCYFKKGEFNTAAEYLERAAACIKETFGETEAYKRVKENAMAAREAMGNIRGIDICKDYYETFGKPMLEEKFSDYLDKITVGLCGEGSDCFGYDDAVSKDHDWGPGFIMWVDQDAYDEIGKSLSDEYEKLPKEFKGYSRTVSAQGKDRMGVCIAENFYNRILGINWRDSMLSVPDWAFATATNGQIFHSSSCSFEATRAELKKGYPLNVHLRRMAQFCALFSQGAQYNYPRMMRRGDTVAARLSLVKGIENGMRLIYETEDMYAPHDKWLYKGLSDIPDTEEERMLIWKILGSNIGQDTEEMLISVERLAGLLVERIYVKGYILDDDKYLDSHTSELATMAQYADLDHKKLVIKIAETEFEAFDKVRNEGGRASCQNDWPTFRIMRCGQYDVWTDEMLVRYLYDFNSMMAIGRNPITEKYGRMMMSTDPEKYEELKKDMPEITEEQMQIINAITAIQVDMMEDYSERFPEIAERARNIHTAEDSLYSTSYETYLRGELMTYSAQMLIMYGRLIAGLKAQGKNIAELIIQNELDMIKGGYFNS